MSLTAPIPWNEALNYLRSRALMPTDWGSAALSTLDRGIRERSLFSARTTNAEYLQEVGNGLDAMASGTQNEATTRAELQRMLDGMGYDPEAGGFVGGDAPTAGRGGLQDLSSDKRVKLVLETNIRQTANFAYRKQGLSEETKWQFPAWELLRVYFKKVPRGSSGMPNDPGWEERWVRSGGKLYAGRMIAAKGDAVWNSLGDSGVWEDGLDNPYPPFAFNSGYGIQEISRDECDALGVPIDSNEGLAPEGELNDELKVNAEAFDDDFLAALEGDLRTQAGELRLRNRRAPAARCLALVDALCGRRAA